MSFEEIQIILYLIMIGLTIIGIILKIIATAYARSKINKLKPVLREIKLGNTDPKEIAINLNLSEEEMKIRIDQLSKANFIDSVKDNRGFESFILTEQGEKAAEALK